MKKILVVAISIVVFIGALMGLYLYQSNKEAARFTVQLNELQQKGPEVISDTLSDQNILDADVAEIQSIYQKRNEAWCEADGTKYASFFTEDADFVSFDGTHTIGREEIARSHQELFDTFLKNTCLRGYIERIKFLGENTAIAYVISGTQFDGKEAIHRPSIQTHVVVKKDGVWLFSSFHNGRIDRVDDMSILRKAWLGIQTFVFRR